MANVLSQASAEACETRCECGQLIAKVRGHALELKCKRCKRIVLIPFDAIEGWTAASSRTIHEKV
jgi:phage FluMu protein Com